jgi:NAD(P)-dependent dehydrogenase (short-subunit alcohol dehydrogenase family)
MPRQTANLDGRVAIVTGASSGIGAAVARELASRRATVVGVARRGDRLAQVVEECQADSPSSTAHVADVGVEEACRDVVQTAEERFGRVDVIVNNAGISIHRHAVSTPPEDVARLMAVNFFGPVNLTMAALPGMVDRGEGWVINVTSVAGYVPNPGESAYGASKAALSRWSHGLNVDLAGTGVHVGVLSPGPIDTEIWGLDETVTYNGKLYPPAVIAKGVSKMIDRRLTHLTVPRQYGMVGALYPLFGRPMRWGMRKYESRPGAAAPRG